MLYKPCNVCACCTDGRTHTSNGRITAQCAHELRCRSHAHLRYKGDSHLEMCAQVAMTVARTLAMHMRPDASAKTVTRALATHRRITAFSVRASCDDGRTHACEAAASRRSNVRACSMTVTYALATHRRLIAFDVRASCKDGRTCTCDASATHRVLCACMM